MKVILSCKIVKLVAKLILWNTYLYCDNILKDYPTDYAIITVSNLHCDQKCKSHILKIKKIVVNEFSGLQPFLYIATYWDIYL